MGLTRCRISEIQQLRLLELFVAQATARTASELIGIHRNSAALYYHKLRQLIAAKMGETEPEMAVFECDESYFGGARKGRRGRGGRARSACSASSSAAARCTRCRSLMRPAKPC